MAIEDWDLNLFTSDPTLLERASDEEYERAAAGLERLADPRRLRLLHALSLGEDTAQRAAVWAGVEQSYAERELAALALLGIVERRESRAVRCTSLGTAISSSSCTWRSLRP